MTSRGRGAQGWSDRGVDSGFQGCGDKFCCFGDLRGRSGETGPTGDSGPGHEPSATLSKPTRRVVSATQDQPWAGGGGHPAGHSSRSGTARRPEAHLSPPCSGPLATDFWFGFAPCRGQISAPRALGKERRPRTTSLLPREEFMKPVTPLPGSRKGPASSNCQPLSPGGPSFPYFPLNGVSLGSQRNTATIKHRDT